jgi:hypothetical protein
MSYLQSLASLANPSSPVGAPPRVGPNVGKPPPANPEVAPPPYDAAHDPAWKAHVDPHDHAWRNFINGLDADSRELLRGKLNALSGGAPAPLPTPPPPPAPIA